MRPGRVLKAAALVLVAVLASGQAAFAADEISDGQWYHQLLDTVRAHDTAQGRGITVAVIDTGVDANHPDLAGAVLPGIDLSALGPGDGRTDIDGHGTAMASLIAGNGRVKGVAPAAKILPARVAAILDVRVELIVDAINWAVAKDAKVISISLTTSMDDSRLREAVRAAIAADVVVVAGVGNDPSPLARVAYPAALPGVVAAASVDRNGEHSELSTTGSEVVIAAPGGGVSSAYRNGKYFVGPGTSNATAITAGAVALIRSRYPEMKAAEVVRRLTTTATDKGAPGRDHEYGYGVLNLVAALTADLPPDQQTTPSTPDKPALPLWLLLLAGGLLAAAAITTAILIAITLSRSRRPPDTA